MIDSRQAVRAGKVAAASFAVFFVYAMVRELSWFTSTFPADTVSLAVFVGVGLVLSLLAVMLAPGRGGFLRRVAAVSLLLVLLPSFGMDAGHSTTLAGTSMSCSCDGIMFEHESSPYVTDVPTQYSCVGRVHSCEKEGKTDMELLRLECRNAEKGGEIDLSLRNSGMQLPAIGQVDIVVREGSTGEYNTSLTRQNLSLQEQERAPMVEVVDAAAGWPGPGTWADYRIGLDHGLEEGAFYEVSLNGATGWEVGGQCQVSSE